MSESVIDEISRWEITAAMNAVARVLLPADGTLPPNLPELVASCWNGPVPLEGQVDIAIDSAWWRPISHFQTGSYELLDGINEHPPQLPAERTLELVTAGMTMRGPGGAPMLASPSQIRRAEWCLPTWKLGSHIAPPPGILTVTLMRPPGWVQPPAPRRQALAA